MQSLQQTTIALAMARNTRRRLDEEIATHEVAKKDIKALRLANAQLKSSIETLEQENNKSKIWRKRRKSSRHPFPH